MTPKRIQRRRVKGWRTPDGAVYVGRPTVAGNPFRVGVPFCGPTITTLHTPAEVVAKFREWVTAETLHPLFWDSDLIADHVRIKALLDDGDLRGKDLVCWCPLDQPCHADVLLEIVAEGDA